MLVGLLGFTASASMEEGHLLGLFPVNVLHNIVHIAIGAWGLASYRSYSGSVAYARALAILYAVLTVLAFVSPDTFGLIPIGGNDIWLHALTALIAAYFGFMAPREAIETIDASRRR